MDDNMKPDYKFSDFVSETLNVLSGKAPKKTIVENVADDYGVSIENGYLEQAITETNPKLKEVYKTAFANAYPLFHGLAEVFSAFSDWSLNKTPSTYSILNEKIKSLKNSTNAVKKSQLTYNREEKNLTASAADSWAKEQITALNGMYADMVYTMINQLVAGIKMISNPGEINYVKSKNPAMVGQMVRVQSPSSGLGNTETEEMRIAITPVLRLSDFLMSKSIDVTPSTEIDQIKASMAFLKSFGEFLDNSFKSAKDAEQLYSTQAAEDATEKAAEEGAAADEAEMREEALKNKTNINFDYLTQEEIEEVADQFATELRDLKRIGVHTDTEAGQWESDDSFLKRLVGKLANVSIDVKG